MAEPRTRAPKLEAKPPKADLDAKGVSAPGGALKRRVVDLLGRYPERAVAVLRGWINETRA